ncbi:MAG: DNA methyltransferase [Candidatus Solibacter sp.]|jgi:DNA modification methylase
MNRNIHKLQENGPDILRRTTEIQIERWPVDRLVSSVHNPRTHSREQITQIGASIQEFGFVNPILVGPDGAIIAGEGRLRAARAQGLSEVPVVVLGHLSEIQRQALVLADNQLALNGGWDEKLLGEQLTALKDEGFDLDLLGFDDQELARQLAQQEAAGITDEDEIPDFPSAPVTRPGDLWLLGPRKGVSQHRVLCGDATASGDATRLLGGQPLPLIMVTDPPYGVDLEPEWREEAGLNPRTRQGGKVANDDRIDWSEAWALFPGAVAYVWHAGIHAAEVALGLQSCGFQIRSQIVWVKQHFAISRGAYHWRHEPCWYAVRRGQTGHWRGDRTQSTVWEVSNLNPFGGERAAENEATGHGTQKPVEIMRRPILNHIRPGEACYDPFLGSGSTLIAAESTGRICYAMEIDPKYVDVAVLRWQRFSGRDAILDGDLRTFEEIARVRKKEVA